MSKTKFRVRGKGRDAADAFKRVAHQFAGRDGIILIADQPDDVQRAIEKKRKRVFENLGLYGDKLAEYDLQLRQFGELKARLSCAAEVVAEGMFLHGDSRLDDRRKVCAVELRPREFLFFGYDF